MDSRTEEQLELKRTTSHTSSWLIFTPKLYIRISSHGIWRPEFCAKNCCWFTVVKYWVIAWGRWRGDFFPSGRWCWIGPLMVVSPPEPYFHILIKHLRFFYSHVFQWCIVLLASLIYANPWIDYECMPLVVSFSCLICRISCSWAREKTWIWEQAANKGDWIDHLRNTLVSGSLPSISCMS